MVKTSFAKNLPVRPCPFLSCSPLRTDTQKGQPSFKFRGKGIYTAIGSRLYYAGNQSTKQPRIIACTLVNLPALIAMKIKFKLTQATHVAPRVVVDKIVSLLEGNDYRITNLTSSIVEFNDSTWKLRWRHEATARLDGGKFELSVSGDEVLVTFSYYTSLTVQLLIFIALSIALIKDHQYIGILFFLAFYLFGISIQLITQRGTAKNMLKSILSSLP
ncbi:hypothetical protein [Mucilaginibacter ginsenosidivorax]|uniref:Uncharacterized protein n=1 Tax=Mucilaginibacter ginsenosidivorax TaxID=862126 RepID=A0A5B8VWR8_9SPHI|nr:hypothetical protein [Mucilaginibacter ginsenosidivorax]QEC75641.1 hypothetical protein FSB76_06645 [Mucilaginibacter ginsenosidivorax]